MQSKPRRSSRRSIRIPEFDYTDCGTCFVTVCAHRGQGIFGRIVDGKMCLAALGVLVREQWERLAAHFEGLSLGSFVVMPNHLHGILRLLGDGGTASRAPTAERFGRPVPRFVPTIVRSFKSGVTREARRAGLRLERPVWQRGYFEHVVRNDSALEKINEYIATNPRRWDVDRENAEREGRDQFDEWLESFRSSPGNRPPLRTVS